MEVKLTSIKRFDKDKEGNPLKSKTGRPYTRLVIETEEHDKSLSGFENIETKNWKVGDTVNVEVKENGQYLNFSVPKKEALQSEDMKQIKEDLFKIIVRIGALHNDVRILMEHSVPKKAGMKSAGYPTPEEEGIDVDNVFPDERF